MSEGLGTVDGLQDLLGGGQIYGDFPIRASVEMVDSVDESAIVKKSHFEGEGAVNTVIVPKLLGDPFECGFSKNG